MFEGDAEDMLGAETAILCALFFVICYINTGSDEKNIKSYSSYPDEVQNIVKERPVLKEKTRITNSLTSFLSNILVFGVVLLIFGFFIKEKDFSENFINLMILGQCLNAFDFLIIDMLWWRNTKRTRFTGTENMSSLYKKPKKHLVSFFKGILVFFIVALADGLILSLV